MFKHIIKYWVRTVNSDNALLVAAVKTNRKLLQENKESWERIITFLLKAIDINIPTENQTEKIQIPNIQQKLQTLYKDWWTNQAKPTGANKLDFYYQHKKTFKYESYLDTIPRYIRIHTTRLRVSSHTLPIELLRYSKTRKTRENRICPICNNKEIGDEMHYLLTCNNSEISRIRETFMKNIREEVPQLAQFSDKNIIDYCMILHDQRIQMPMSIFIKNILCMYKEETEGLSISEERTIVTRIGRTVKKPNKLNL